MVNKEISLDIWGENKARVFVNQGEMGSKILKVIFKDRGENVDLTGKTVVIYMKKPDGNIVYNHCEISNQGVATVIVDITSQISVLSGLINCEFHILGTNNETLKITGLQIIVLDCDNVNSIIESTSEFTLLSQYISIVNNLITQISDPKFIINNLGISSGSWSPYLGSRDGVDPSYTEYYKYGMYYTIGSMVYISFRCKMEITNPGTGYACIKGLPFKSISSGVGGQGLSIIEVEGVNRQGGVGFIPDDSTQIFMRTMSGDVEQSWVTGTAIIGYSGCYMKSAI